MKAAAQVNEKCWILVGNRRGSIWPCMLTALSEGSPVEVEFSFDSVIRREVTHGDTVGFLHTHPSGSLAASRIDVATMRAWTSCLGRSLLCLIACEQNVQAHLFVDDECSGIRLAVAEYIDDASVIVCDRRLSHLERRDD